MLPKNFMIGFALLFFLVGVVCFIGFAFYGWVNPLKERTAWAPSFNPYNFRFEDYQAGDSLQKNLGHILKQGIDVKEVDKILVSSAGATKTYVGESTKEAKYRYCYIPWYATLQALRYLSDEQGYDVFITYDARNKTKEYFIKGTRADSCKSSRGGDYHRDEEEVIKPFLPWRSWRW